MIIRPAKKEDIPFIVKGILEIEKNDENQNTYNNLFGTKTEKTISYITQIFEDTENIDTELSLNTFIIAEVEGTPAGFCCLIYTDKNYYLNKSEIFPIHLESPDLKTFIANASSLPEHRVHSEYKHFIEYIYTNKNFRRRGIAEKMIEHQASKISENKVYINVFQNKPELIKYYKKLGYNELITTTIDRENNPIYPSKNKIILVKIKD